MASERQGVAVLGSTGSIGRNTLDVLARHPDRFRVVALGAGRRVEPLAEQCLRFRPDYAALADPQAAARLAARLRTEAPRIRVLGGVEGLEQVAALSEVHRVMAAIVGAAGLASTLAAVRAGKWTLLANKEALVIGGDLLIDEARRSGAQILPVDSEHNAIFQSLPDGVAVGARARGVRSVLLTGSGGPFREWPLAALPAATPEQATAHPNWRMGPKISVDSATMMNKGLELIEACRLFGLEAAEVEATIHPQSVIHSLVRYVDGSLLAQLSVADMRIPIAHALAWPERVASGADELDLAAIARLDFERPDPLRYPCLQLAAEAMRLGGSAPAILNAANEVAVAAFLERRIGFTEIARIVSETLERVECAPADSLEAVLAVDRHARRAAAERIESAGEG